MISIFTGVPGTGKTALVVSELNKIQDRPIFVMGIPDLKIEHQPVPPIAEWTELRPDPDDPGVLLPYFTFPPNSLIVIDEAQRVYRPRTAGTKVPPIVAAFETHRHTGVDFWLVTQDAGLLDSNIRKLVTRHVHIRATAIGRYKYEWPELGVPDNKSSRELARRDRYTPPRDAFPLYKSAEVHTKVRLGLPWYYFVFAFAFLASCGLLYYGYNRIASFTDKGDGPVNKIDSNINAKPKLIKASRNELEDYLIAQKPRLEGLLHTAPVYDQVAAPKVVPEVVGCYSTKKTGCRCLTQQGTPYNTTKALCEDWLANGVPFKPWKEPEIPPLASPQQSASVPPLSESSGPTVGLIQAPPPVTLSEDKKK